MDMNLLPERVLATDPGYAIRDSQLKMYYQKKHYKSFSWSAMFETFSASTWIAIGGMNLTFLVTLFFTSLDRSQATLKTIIDCFDAILKSIMSESFDAEHLIPHFKRTKFIFLFNLSLTNGFFFWCFSGILISNLTVQQPRIPINSLEALKHDSDGLKLVVFKGSATHSFVSFWADQSDENRQTFQQKIMAISRSNTKETLNSDQNVAVYMSVYSLAIISAKGYKKKYVVSQLHT